MALLSIVELELILNKTLKSPRMNIYFSDIREHENKVFRTYL